MGRFYDRPYTRYLTLNIWEMAQDRDIVGYQWSNTHAVLKAVIS